MQFRKIAPFPSGKWELHLSKLHLFHQQSQHGAYYLKSGRKRSWVSAVLRYYFWKVQLLRESYIFVSKKEMINKKMLFCWKTAPCWLIIVVNATGRKLFPSRKIAPFPSGPNKLHLSKLHLFQNKNKYHALYHPFGGYYNLISGDP